MVAKRHEPPAGLGQRPEARRFPEALGDEGELLARCRTGERPAFRELYVRYFDQVAGTARRLGTPPAELDDVTQEVFALAYQKLNRFDGGSFGAWLHRICANLVTDHHRKRRVRLAFRRLWPAREEVDQGPDPERLAGQSQAADRVASILARMRPKQREVFALFEIEGLSGEEIAERVGCPVNTVWTRLYHARRDFLAVGGKLGLLEGVEGARE